MNVRDEENIFSADKEGTVFPTVLICIMDVQFVAYYTYLGMECNELSQYHLNPSALGNIYPFVVL